MRVFLFTLTLILVHCKSSRKKLLRTLPKYRNFKQNDELSGGVQSSEEDEELLINPSRSWAQFMSQNEDDSVGSEIEKDFGISTKSTGSERLNSVEVIAGPRGPRGPPGILKLDEFTDALQLLREVDGEVKRGRKGRYKPGGPVLNVVFSNGAREVDQGSNTAGETAGFLGSLKTDLYLQRLSRIQINNFVRPKASHSSFNFNRGGAFDHKSGALVSPLTGVYILSATVNFMRMPDIEAPGYEDFITGRICMDDNCLSWALETKIPVLQNKFSNLKIDGLVRIEAGNKVFLFVENNSDVNFKILRSSSFSAHVLGPTG